MRKRKIVERDIINDLAVVHPHSGEGVDWIAVQDKVYFNEDNYPNITTKRNVTTAVKGHEFAKKENRSNRSR
jgi:hypothetical protein